MPGWPRKIDLAVVAALILPLVAVAPMFAHAGVPAFQHDWLWPVHPAQIGNFMTSGFQAWRRDGIGAPPVYPTAWWPYVLGGLFCYAAGVHGGLIVFVYAPLALAAFGIMLLARTMGSPPVGQLGAIAIYGGNPFVLNELQAGHLVMLWAYGLLPWIAYSVYAAPTPARMFTAGVLVGLAAAQQQFFFFGILAALFIMLARYPKRAYTIVPVSIIAAAACMPEWIAAASTDGVGTLNMLLPVPSWDLAQSSTIAQAARTVGYIGGYDRSLPHLIGLWLWAPPAIALAGVLLHRSRAAFAFVAIAVAGVLIAAGVRGPLGPLWWYGFEHLQALTVLRELYDAAALTALAVAALCALALARVRWSAVQIVLAAIVALPMVYIASRASAQLTWVSPQSPIAAAVDAIAARSGDDRVLPLPVDAPLAVGDARGGFSPLSIGIGAHPSAAATVPSSPVTYLARTIEAGDARTAAALANRTGVGIAVAVPSMHSGFARVAEPRLKTLARSFPGEDANRARRTAFSAPRVAVVPFSAAAGTLARPYIGARDLRAVSGGQPFDVNTLQTDASPSLSWVRTALWPILPRWVFAESSGVFTARTRAQLIVPPAWIVAGDAVGTIHAQACARVRRLDAHFALLRCSQNPELRGSAPLVVASVTLGGSPAKSIAQTGAAGDARVLQTDAARLVLHVRGIAGSALVLRERYDSGWICSLAGARHVLVDGYANAWILPSNVNDTVTISYRPAAAFYVALAVSIGLVALFAIVPITLRLRIARRLAMQPIT